MAQMSGRFGGRVRQLGYAAGGAKEAEKAFSRVQADDERATSPGDMLLTLMNEYGPCLSDSSRVL
jgi:hypothetical protein